MRYLPSFGGPHWPIRPVWCSRALHGRHCQQYCYLWSMEDISTYHFHVLYVLLFCKSSSRRHPDMFQSVANTRCDSRQGLAASTVRIGALRGLPVIHIANHGFFAEGMNGPTRQPVELDSLYQDMPNLAYIRNAIGPVPSPTRHAVVKGAYVIQEDEKRQAHSCQPWHEPPPRCGGSTDVV